MPIVHDKPISVAMERPAQDAALHYTLDGTEPTQQSPRYAGPIKLSETTTVKVKAFQPGQEPSPVYSESYVLKAGK